MAKGRNLRASNKDAKALKQEKILKKLEEKKMKKRKSHVWFFLIVGLMIEKGRDQCQNLPGLFLLGES